ncbi:head-tail joining protein [Azospirillum aestuarii]|uniref:head-tail joining protein n=1 Tax=Azospirillum aestuarii TaxID=2802052 RepID=UPI004055167C
MDFSPHLRTLFQLRGKPASYAPTAGAPVPCRAIRQGGGQVVAIGPVVVMLERVQFHIRRAEVPAPEIGAVLTVNGDTFTVQAVQPVQRDADGLMWGLDVAWGLPVIYRTAAAPGGVQGGPWSVVTAAAAGTSSISIQSQHINVTGKLQLGDVLTIGGAAYTVGAVISASAAKSFNNIPISPPLAAPVVAGASVTITQPSATGYAITGAMADYGASEVMGSVLVGDRRMVILQAAFVVAGLPAGPKPGASIEADGRIYNVIHTKAHYAGSAVAAWELQVRG